MNDIIQNTFGYPLSFALTQDGSPLNLSGGSIVFKTVTTTDNLPGLTKACDILVAGSGTCSFTVGSMDFTTVGAYNWQVTVTWADKSLAYQGSDWLYVKKVF